MGHFRHPFDAAPDARAAYLVRPLAVDLRLDAQDRGWIRGLRPETAALWATTAGSALFSILVYCAIWDASIAWGLVLGMWVHELGHLAALRRLGLESGPIVFVPFIGAMQRVLGQPARALDAARIALAGPACGLLFAAACKVGYAMTGYSALRFLATAHAILAVIDLLPFGMLDGRRVVAVLTRRERVACAAVTALLAMIGQSLMLVPIGMALAWTGSRPAPTHAQPWIATALVAVLAAALLLT